MEGVVPDKRKSNPRSTEARGQKELDEFELKRGSEDEVVRGREWEGGGGGKEKGWWGRGREGKVGEEERRIYKGCSSGSSATSRCDAHVILAHEMC